VLHLYIFAELKL